VLRFGLQTGELLQAVQFAPTTAGREIGPGLYDPGQRKPELLEASRGSSIGWRERLATVFPPAGAITGSLPASLRWPVKNGSNAR
jgi:hypothetical protein